MPPNDPAAGSAGWIDSGVLTSGVGMVKSSVPTPSLRSVTTWSDVSPVNSASLIEAGASGTPSIVFYKVIATNAAGDAVG
ncbi:MAG: hypothetical protein ACREAA_17610 [Candidatus Polarisedimenticolia bacterium]